MSPSSLSQEWALRFNLWNSSLRCLISISDPGYSLIQLPESLMHVAGQLLTTQNLSNPYIAAGGAVMGGIMLWVLDDRMLGLAPHFWAHLTGVSDGEIYIFEVK
jgi:hypothetical protein